MATAEETSFKVEELSFNKRINLVKLLLSSLFARKQNYLVVNGNRRNKLLYTNIPDDRVVFYKADIDDTLNVIQLTEKAAETLYEIFPRFKDTVAIIHLPSLMSSMNKRLSVLKNKIPELVVDPESGRIYMDIPLGKDKQVEELFVGKESANGMQRVEVGHLIVEDIFVKYEEVISNHLSFIKEPIEREVSVSSAVGDDRFVLNKVELPDATHNCTTMVNLPLADGESVISYKEYLSKKKMPWKYRVLIMYNDRHSVAKVAYAYRDDLIDGLCMSPGTLWFPFRKQCG